MVALNNTHGDRSHRGLAWFIWFFCGLFYLYQFILRASPSVLASDLMEDFGMNASSFGVLAACYYYAYTALQIPLGALFDRWGPSRILRIAVLVCSLGTFLFAFAPHLWIAAAGRLLIGAGAAGAFLGAVRLGSMWFPASQLALIVGLTVSLGKVGGISATVPLTFLIERFNWRITMGLLGLVGLVLTCLIWIVVRDRAVQEKVDEPESPETLGAALIFLIKKPAVWSVALYGSLMYVPLSVFADAWGVSFLMKNYELDKATASGMVGLLFVGTFFGAPLAAVLSDWLKNRRIPMVLSALLSLLWNCTLIFGSNFSVVGIGFLLFAIGVSIAAQPLVFTVISEFAPPKIGGTATGFLNAIIMMGGVILQPLIGFILDWRWGGALAESGRLYTVQDYQYALSTIPLCMLLSLVLTLCFIPETRKS